MGVQVGVQKSSAWEHAGPICISPHSKGAPIAQSATAALQKQRRETLFFKFFIVERIINNFVIAPWLVERLEEWTSLKTSIHNKAMQDTSSFLLSEECQKTGSLICVWKRGSLCHLGVSSIPNFLHQSIL